MVKFKLKITLYFLFLGKMIYIIITHGRPTDTMHNFLRQDS